MHWTEIVSFRFGQRIAFLHPNDPVSHALVACGLQYRGAPVAVKRALPKVAS